MNFGCSDVQGKRTWDAEVLKKQSIYSMDIAVLGDTKNKVSDNEIKGVYVDFYSRVQKEKRVKIFIAIKSTYTKSIKNSSAINGRLITIELKIQ